jgi:hypothetical protein
MCFGVFVMALGRAENHRPTAARRVHLDVSDGVGYLRNLANVTRGGGVRSIDIKLIPRRNHLT